MKIEKLLSDIYLIDIGPTYIVGVEHDNNVVLFDTAIDSSAGKKLDKCIGKSVSAIYNTHSHADHIGANLYFTDKYNIPVFIDRRELSFVEMPELEPALLYGGLYFSGIGGKFLKAPPSKNIQQLNYDKFLIGDVEITPIKTYGHSPGLTSFLLNKYLYAGDAIFSEQIIEKYKILYLYDPKMYYNSIDILRDIEFEYMIYCHKGIVSKAEFIHLAEINKEHLREVKKVVYNSSLDLSVEEITSLVLKAYAVDAGFDLFMLALSTIKGYLSWLESEGVVMAELRNGVKWKKC